MAAVPQQKTLKISITASNTDDANTIAENSVSIPTTIQSSNKTLEQCYFDKTHCKVAVKYFNIIGGPNAERASKLNVLASKMLQRKVSIATICKIIDGSADASSLDCALFNELLATKLRVQRNSNDQEAVIWLK